MGFTLQIKLFNSNKKLFEAEIAIVTQRANLILNTLSPMQCTPFKTKALALSY